MPRDSDQDNHENLAPHHREKLILSSQLSTRLKCCLLAINHHLAMNLECWPGNDLLANECSVSDRTINRFLTELKDGGYLKVKQRKHRSALLSINWEKFQEPTTVAGLNNQEPTKLTSRTDKTGFYTTY